LKRLTEGELMNGAIVYYSAYGSTKQYADWIAEETGFPVYEQRAGGIPWAEFDTVVIGCPVLKMHPLLKKWIVDTWAALAGKRVFLFTTSGAPPSNPGLREGFAASFPPDITAKIDYSPLQGRMVWKQLKPMHKLFMRIGRMIEKDPVRKEEMVKDVDGVDRSMISPLVERILAAQ
jgi:menaquinone-dependent protoporphyrinogen oxidase